MSKNTQSVNFAGSRRIRLTLRYGALLAGLTLFAAPLQAQVTQARYDSLAARVTALETILGDWSKPISADTLRPPELPNGDYPVAFRFHQLGRAFNDIVTRLPVVESKLPTDGRTVTAYVNAALSTIITNPLQNTVSGNLVVTGKVCVGGPCETGENAQLQLFGNGDANIAFTSNLSRTNVQLGLPHKAWKSLSGDGGFRDMNNWKFSSVGACASLDGVRPCGSVGFDSQSTYSGQQRRANMPGDYTQDWWISINENLHEIGFVSPRANWQWVYGTSSSTLSLDRWYKLPLQ